MKEETRTLKPNILFLVVDSFRADKCFGDNKTSKTPNIDSLIKRGTYFSQTIGSAPASIPALATIFTGLYPFRALYSDLNNHRLHPNAMTYIKILKNNGYNTYATLPDLFSLVGLTRDFQKTTSLPFTDLILSNGLGEKILNELGSNIMKEPWVYYIHMMDLHEINRLPAEFDKEEYGSNRYERMVSAIDSWLGKILQKIDLNNTLIVLTADHGSDTDEHSSNIDNFKNVDNFQQNLIFKLLVKIVAGLPNFLEPVRIKIREKHQSILEEKTLEKIENLNMPLHKKRALLNTVNLVYQVYDEKFHVPLIFSGYGISPQSPISQQVRSVDIFPTIQNIVDIADEKHTVHGRSLLPLIRGEILEEIPVYMESSGNRTRVYTTDEIGIRTSKYKYFRSRKDPKKSVHLYDLKSDPLEENNIANTNLEIIERMEKVLTVITTNSNDPQEEKTVADDITKEQVKKIEEELRKLGYRNVKKTLEK